MNAILIIGALLLIGLGVAQKNAAAAGVNPAVTIAGQAVIPPANSLPNGQPVTMTAEAWTQYVDGVISKYVGSTVGSYQKSAKFRTWAANCIAARQLIDVTTSEGVIPGNCGTPSKPGTLLTADLMTSKVAGLVGSGITGAVQISAGITSTAASAGGGLLPAGLASAIPIVGIAFGAVTAAIALFAAHHAQAMAEEKQYLCAYVPSANLALQTIDAQFRAGALGGGQAIQALENLWTGWLRGIGPIAKPSATEYTTDLTSVGEGGTCNAACGFSLALRMIIDVREQVDY